MYHVLSGSFAAVTDSKLVDYFEAPGATPTVSEFVEYLEGRTTFRVVVDRMGVTPPTVEKMGAQNYKGPGLAVQWVEVEGPLYDTWPPPGHRRIFGDLPQTRIGTDEFTGQPRLEVVSGLLHHLFTKRTHILVRGHHRDVPSSAGQGRV